MISNPSKYAIKSLVHIVNYSSEENKLLVKDIARAIEVPKPYLSKILQALSNKNFLSSTKGPGGGFYITDKQLNHSVYDVVVEIEGKDKLAQCILSFEECDAENPCPVHNIIAPAKNKLRERFKQISLGELREADIIEM